MQKTARAIIKYNDKYVFIKRVKIKNDTRLEYYATPGGHLEKDEDFEDACIREVEEELGIVCKIDSLFLEMYNEDIDTYEKYYICSYVSGTIGTGSGEEFTARQDFEKYGSYEIVYVDEIDIETLNILPKVLKEKLTKKD